MVRVLLLSDVYFPRVNGVSTSIKTFRDDLPAAGVTSVLLAPNYPGESHENQSDIVRVASSGVPRDPEDRRMHLGALRRALAALRREPFDLVHIHTPFLAHYAGVRFARAAGIPAVATYHTFFEEYLHHYVPLLPRPLGRMIARRFGPLPAPARKRIESLTPAKLDRIALRLLDATSLEELLG